MRAIAVPAAVVTAMLVARSAAADDLHLAWRAPAGCPTGESVREAALKAATGDGPREPLDVEARVVRGARWQVVIRTTRNGAAAAERRIEAASCAALADATAVILAIAMIPPGRAADEKGAKTQGDAKADDADAKASANADANADAKASADAKADADADTKARVGAGADPTAGGAQRPVSTVAAAREAERPDAAPEAYRHVLAGSVAGATDGTTLPSAALGARIALAWTPGRTRLEVGGSYFSAQSKTADASAAGARFTLLVAGGRACWAVLQGALEIAPCAGAAVQIMSARGFGAPQNYEANGAWMSATGGALVRLPIASWLALRADADAVVPMTRPRFVVEGDGAVHRPSAVGGRAGFGVELLFL